MTTPLGADQGDLDSVAALVRAAGTSFYRGMAVLPPDRRYAMYAIYAFCRIVDDIADDPGDFAEKLPRLNRWRERIAGLYRGRAEDAVTRVLVRAVKQFRLRQADFEAVIDGMQMDARDGHRGAERRRRSTSIATGWPPRSGGFRCGRSAMPRPMPTSSPTISAARCN